MEQHTNNRTKTFWKGRILVILLIMLTAVWICGCAKKPSMQPTGNKTSPGTLPAMEINPEKGYRPDDGITEEKAMELLKMYKTEDGHDYKLYQTYEVTEITSKESWDNNGLQLFKVSDPEYVTSSHAVLIVKDGKLLGILGGMPVQKVFLSDLDEDGLYEVYINIFFGSGIVSQDILGYNVAQQESYRLSMRMFMDLELFMEDQTLLVKKKPAMGLPESDQDADISIMKLILNPSLNAPELNSPDTAETPSKYNLGLSLQSKDIETPYPIKTDSKVEIYLPKETAFWFTPYAQPSTDFHELELMDTPLFNSNEIESFSQNGFEVNQPMIIISATPETCRLVYDGVTFKEIHFTYENTEYAADASNTELIYDYARQGVSVVKMDDKVFFIKQKEFIAPNFEGYITEKKVERVYHRGPVGVPYVLVVDGVKVQLGVIQMGEGDFPVPSLIDSWSFAGFPADLPVLIPDTKVLRYNTLE